MPELFLFSTGIITYKISITTQNLLQTSEEDRRTTTFVRATPGKAKPGFMQHFVNLSIQFVLSFRTEVRTRSHETPKRKSDDHA